MKLRNILSLCLIIAFAETFSQNYGVWSLTDSLYENKQNHVGVQLDNGNILVTGGYTFGKNTASNETEIFDVSKKKWNVAAQMNKGRAYHDLIRLDNGSILAIGGFKETSCELLNTNYSSWSFTDSLKKERYYGQSALILQNGNVLVSGGYYFKNTNNTDESIKECELYDNINKKWIVINNMNVGRYNHTTTLLQNGQVLVVGGNTIQNGVQLLNSCEIYDVMTDKWILVSPMHYPRAKHSATLLKDGKVLVIGGQQQVSELYDPITNTWTNVGTVMLSSGHNRAIKLRNEECLLLVHDSDGYILRPGWEIFSLKDFNSVYYEKFDRIITDQVITKIDESKVLVTGGEEFRLIGSDLLLLPVKLSLFYDIDITDVKNGKCETAIPDNIQISCYPNPTNGSTNVSVQVSKRSIVSIKVYNIIGSEISTIYCGELNEGKYLFKWNMNSFSSSIYFIRMCSQGQIKTIKLIHQK